MKKPAHYDNPNIVDDENWKQDLDLSTTKTLQLSHQIETNASE
jgi:hypothetical protein